MEPTLIVLFIIAAFCASFLSSASAGAGYWFFFKDKKTTGTATGTKTGTKSGTGTGTGTTTVIATGATSCKPNGSAFLETNVGSKSTVPCGIGYSGTQSATCQADGNFTAPDRSLCKPNTFFSETYTATNTYTKPENGYIVNEVGAPEGANGDKLTIKVGG